MSHGQRLHMTKVQVRREKLIRRKGNTMYLTRRAMHKWSYFILSTAKRDSLSSHSQEQYTLGSAAISETWKSQNIHERDKKFESRNDTCNL